MVLRSIVAPFDAVFGVEYHHTVGVHAPRLPEPHQGLGQQLVFLGFDALVAV